MIVAVIAVRMMQVAGNAIIYMIAMWHRLMATPKTMYMVRRMAATAVIAGAAVRVIARHLDPVLIDMAVMRVMKMTVVQIIHMAAVVHGGMAAARPMLMRVVEMGLRRASRHLVASFPCPRSADTAVRLSASWSMALRINRSTCSSAKA